MGLEELVSKRRDRALSGRTFEALGQGEEPAGSGDGAGDGGVRMTVSSRSATCSSPFSVGTTYRIVSITDGWLGTRHS